MDGLLLLLKKGRRREFLDDFVLWRLLSFHYSIFIVFTPNAKQQQQKRKENEERRRFREVEIGGGPISRRLSKVPLYAIPPLGKQKKRNLRTPPPPLFKQLHFSTPRISAQLKRTPQKKKSRVIINAVVFARVVQTVLSAVSLYRLLALRYSSREKKPIVLVEKKYTSIC